MIQNLQSSKNIKWFSPTLAEGWKVLFEDKLKEISWIKFNTYYKPNVSL